MNQHREVIIIGSGPAGYAAGIYAARNGNSPLIITGTEFGGQITKTFDLENYPGFTEKIDGIFISEQMRKQAEIFGAKILADTVIDVDFSKYPYTIKCETGETLTANSIIIATGASHRKLGLPNEEKLTGNGVSYCATCDGFFFKGKDVFVIGGGNAAVYEALHLSTICNHVTIVHRRDILTAEGINQTHLKNTPNISILFNSIVEDIVADKDGKVAQIQIKDTKTNKTKDYPTPAVFIAVGNTPNTSLFKDKLELDNAGYIITKPNLTQTNIDGVFAAGDVKNPVFKQVVIAAASGAQAAMEATKYIIDASKFED